MDKGNYGRIIIKAGLIGLALYASYWFYKRHNLNNQVQVGSPKSPRLSGGKLHISLPVTNISDVDVTFDGFIGNFISYYNNQNGTVVGTAVANTPAGGTIIKAKSETIIDVVISLTVISAGSVLLSLINSGDWSEANCYLKGRYYIMSNLEFEYEQKLV